MLIWINFPTTDDTIRFLVEVKRAGDRGKGDFTMIRYMDKLGDRGVDAVGLVIAGGDVSIVGTNPETGVIEVLRRCQLLSNEFMGFLDEFLE